MLHSINIQDHCKRGILELLLQFDLDLANIIFFFNLQKFQERNHAWSSVYAKHIVIDNARNAVEGIGCQ